MAESKVGLRLRGCRGGAHRGACPKTGSESMLREQQGGQSLRAQRNRAGQRVCKWARGVEEGTSQETEKRRWESPRVTAGSVIPAFLTCVLTVFCMDTNQNPRVGRQSSSRKEKVRPPDGFPCLPNVLKVCYVQGLLWAQDRNTWLEVPERPMAELAYKLHYHSFILSLTHH